MSLLLRDTRCCNHGAARSLRSHRHMLIGMLKVRVKAMADRAVYLKRWPVGLARTNDFEVSELAPPDPTFTLFGQLNRQRANRACRAGDKQRFTRLRLEHE